MGIDASIYSNLQPAKVEIPSPLESAQRAMSLSQLGMQQAQMQRQMQMHVATQQAYAQNTDPSGNVNKQGVLSQLGKMGFGQAATEMGGQFSKLDEERAKAQAAQAEAFQKRASIFASHMDDMMKNVPESQRPQVWTQTIKNLKDQGIVTPDQGIPDTYDPQIFNGFAMRAMHHLGQNSKDYVDTKKTQSETLLAPAKYNAELYGSRSPNAELTSQYDKQVGDVRKSQGAMAQMHDNYKNPSPQGDASLVLNAFKIKFPNAPDVNSLKELSESQSASDHWKNLAHKALSGGFDKSTRDNLMRDGISTYNANYDTWKGIQRRFLDRQKVQNVNDPTLTAEPAIENTYAESMKLKKELGPYVKPADRGGFMAGVNKFASKLIGGSAESAATAAEKPAAPKIKPGTVEDGYVFNGGDPSNPKSWKKRGR